MATTYQEFQNNSISGPSRESEIISLFNECYDFSFRSWSPYLIEASRDMAFFLGDQWDSKDLNYLRQQRRNALVFNKVRRNIKMVTGFERKSRHSLVATAVEGSDEKTADQFTALMLWAQSYDNMAHTISDAFENGPLKTGINLTELSIDYFDDPVNGDPRLLRHSYNQFLLDPRTTKRDLSDCEYITMRRFLSRDTVKALLPFAEREIEMLHPSGEDEKYPYMTRFLDSRSKQALRYDQFWTRKFKTMRVMVDMATGETIEIDESTINDERFAMFMQAFGGRIRVIKKQVPTVELNIIVEDQLLFSGEDPLKIGDFPFTAFFGFWDPEYMNQDGYSDFSLKLQSLVRPGRDPQTESNKRRSKFLDIMDSQINSGWIAENGSVRNPKSLHRSGQGQVVWYERGSSIPQRIPPADIPGNAMGFMQQMDTDVTEAMGITDELLGDPVNDNVQIAGILAKQRQSAGLTVLQDLMDNLALSKKDIGNKLIKFFQKNWSAEKVARVLNEQPTQEFYTGNFGKYDVSVEEAIDTPNAKLLAYSQLTQAVQLGIIEKDLVAERLIDLMNIQDKDKIKEAMQARSQQAQAAQQQQMKDAEIMRNFQKAKSFNEIALGVERVSRAEADKGLAKERISELQQNAAQAELDRAKAIKEMQGMDTNEFLRMFKFLQEVKEYNISQGQAIDQQQQQEVSQDFMNVRRLIGVDNEDDPQTRFN